MKHVKCVLFALSVVLLPFILVGNSLAAIGVPTLSPPVIPTGQDTSVIITASIPDATIISTSINILRVDSSGRTAIIGSLNDQGINGDAQSGDKVFTTTITFNESAGTTINLRISAALRGSLKRITRDFQISVIAIPVIQDYTQYNQIIDDIFLKLVNSRNNFVATRDANIAPVQFTANLQNINNNLKSVYAGLYAIYRFETHSPSNYPKAAEYAPILGGLFSKANGVITEREKFIQNGLDPDVSLIASWCLGQGILDQSELSGSVNRDIRGICAQQYTVHNPSSSFNREVLPEAARIAIKESVGQGTNLIGGGIGDAFGGNTGLTVTGKIIGKGIGWGLSKILDIFIPKSGGRIGLVVGAVADGEVLDVPEGTHDILASSTTDNTRGIARNISADSSTTTTVSFNPGEVYSSIVDSGAEWRYSDNEQAGWTGITFDDSQWNTGTTPFDDHSVTGWCQFGGNGTNWPLYTSLYLRKNIDVPQQGDLTLRIAIDNDFILYFDGNEVAAVNSEGCPQKWQYQYRIPFVDVGTHTISVKISDRGDDNGFDLMVSQAISTVVDSEQPNSFDFGNNCSWTPQTGSRSCCWCPDPTGGHAFGHVMDLQKIVSNIDVSFKIKPGAGDAGCVTDGYMYYSLDGNSWSLFWTRPSLSGWATYLGTVRISDDFRYIRANTDGCSVDYSGVAITQ